MKQEKFILLPFREKLQWIYFRGEHITSIRYYDYKVILYMMDGFYAEVFYHNKESRIVRVEPFDFQHKRIKFYADQIKLPICS